MPRKAAAAPKPAEPAAAAPSPVIGPITNHREAAAAMLVALAGLPPATALSRLATLYATLPQGTARRAVLKARLTLLRDGLPVAAPAPVAVEAAPAPPPPPLPVPKAAPKAGALSTLALEDAARLLAAAGNEEDEDQAETPPAAKAMLPPVKDIFAELAGEGDSDAAPDVDAPPEPPAVAEPAPAKGKGKSARKPAKVDGAAAFVPTPPEAMALDVLGLLSEEAKEEASAADLPDLSAAFAAFDEQAPGTAPDLSAAFAAFARDDPADNVAPTAPHEATETAQAPQKPKTGRRKKSAPPADLSAAFAALSEPADPGPLPPPEALVQGVADRITDLTAEGDPQPPLTAPQPRRVTAEMSGDAVAASLAALIGDGAPTPPVPAMPALDVADRLTRIETAFADEAKGPPKRKLPTDLSAVAATFAALEGGDED